MTDFETLTRKVEDEERTLRAMERRERIAESLGSPILPQLRRVANRQWARFADLKADWYAAGGTDD